MHAHVQEPSDRAGLFITLEGPDGAGKSVVTERLAAWFVDLGVAATIVREPGGTSLGEAIRTVLMDAQQQHSGPADALLFNAARAQLVATVIQPALDRGSLVLCDRYADSTLAYQGYGSGVPLDDLRRIAAISTGGLRPDRTILFDVAVELGLERRRHGPDDQQTRFEDDRRHDRAFHERVRSGYLAMAAAEPDRWRVVDAGTSLDELTAAVKAALGDLLPASVGEPRGTTVRTG
ncbi:MAG TPA: dTMP kinase [Candidatus Limnocylindrales bacterium]